MKSWKTSLSLVLAMLAVMLVSSVPAVADSFEAECEADDGGACRKDVTVSSYEYKENDIEESGENPLTQRAAGECGLFDPFCGLDWWPW